MLLAACRDNQTAADAHFAGEFHGAFTYHLTRILREVGPGCGLPSLIQRLKHDLAAAGFDQEPQLEAPEGLAEGPLFRLNGRGDHSVTVVGMMAPVPLTSTSPAPRPSWAGPTDDRALLAELLAAHNRFLDLAAAPAHAGTRSNSGPGGGSHREPLRRLRSRDRRPPA